MGELSRVYLSVHTPRYCTYETAFAGKLAHPDFRAVRDGLVEQGRQLAGVQPDAIVINSCHLVATFPTVVDGTPRHRGILTAQEAPELIHGVEYDFPGDYELASAIIDRGRAAGHVCTLAADVHYPLDYGTVMPLVCYLDRTQRIPVVPVSVTLANDLEECFTWGQYVVRAVRERRRRAAFVASGSVSHKLVRGPERWPSPEDQELDHRFARMLADGEYEKLWAWLPEYAETVEAEMGGRHLAMMLGASLIFLHTALMAVSPAAAAETVKIGFITSLSGPAGIIGKHMKDSVELALDHLGRKVGGLDVEIIYGDDQRKPDVGKQLADEMLKKHRVHFVSGIIWSNVMLAVAPTVTQAGTFMIGTNAGPHELAGKMCNELFFTTSWQNDQTPEAMGKYMQDQGIRDGYAMAPNYAAGKDMISGFKRYFKGRVVDEVYTKLGQQDYQAEISQIRAAHPKAVFVFYPGDMGIQFVKQYVQAGLREQIPLYSVYTIDEVTLPALKEVAVGIFETRYWSPDLKNEANQKYIGDFRKKFGYTPSFYGTQSYDGILLIDSAVRAVKGDLSNRKGMIAAMRKADYKSTRGTYTYNVNHFPIQNFYLLKTVKGAGGEVEMQIQKTVFENHKDAY